MVGVAWNYFLSVQDRRIQDTCVQTASHAGNLLTGIAPGGFESSGAAIREGRGPRRTQSLRIFQAIATALGLSPEKVLKYSLASHLVAGNVNIALVKHSLGHRSKILRLLSQETYHYFLAT